MRAKVIRLFKESRKKEFSSEEIKQQLTEVFKDSHEDTLDLNSDNGRFRLSYNELECLSQLLATTDCKLQSLGLYDNQIGDPGVALLKQALVSEHCQINSLHLRNNQLTRLACQTLAEVLSNKQNKLKVLSLSNNLDINGEGIESLAEGLLSPHCKLEKLDLKGCAIESKGAKALANVIKSSHSQLIMLNLSSCMISLSGMKDLATALKSPHCLLQSLNICDNYFENEGIEGIQSLSQALQTANNSLTEFAFGCSSSRGDRGIQLITQAVQSTHCQIRSLTLNHDSISEKDMEYLCTAIQSPNNKLESLFFGMYQINDKSFQKFLAALKSPHCHIYNIYTEYGDLTAKQEQQLQSTLKESREQTGIHLFWAARSLRNQNQDKHVQLPYEMIDKILCKVGPSPMQKTTNKVLGNLIETEEQEFNFNSKFFKEASVDSKTNKMTAEADDLDITPKIKN